MKRIWIYYLLMVLLLSTAAGSAAKDAPVLTVMTHDSFAVSQPLLERFEDRHGMTIKILKGGDAGVALNQAILSKANPLADIQHVSRIRAVIVRGGMHVFGSAEATTGIP